MLRYMIRKAAGLEDFPELETLNRASILDSHNWKTQEHLNWHKIMSNMPGSSAEMFKLHDHLKMAHARGHKHLQEASEFIKNNPHVIHTDLKQAMNKTLVHLDTLKRLI